MKYYETVVIIHPALEGGLLKDNIVDIQKLLESKGGDLKNTEVWGRKKLAYLIDKQKYGTYTLLQYTGSSVKINEMNIEMEHNPNVLAYMTIRIDETEMREQTSDLDSQIDGQSAPAEPEETSSPAATVAEEEIPEVSEDEIKAMLAEDEEDIVTGKKPENKPSEESDNSEEKEN